MEVNIIITDDCNAKCVTCPRWSIPGKTMSLDKFKLIFDKVNDMACTTKIILNAVGELYTLPDHIEYLKYAESRRIWTVVLTNASNLDYIPDVDEMIISFNGGTVEAYEATTGLDYYKVIDNIKSKYNEFKKLKTLELHCLMYEGNKQTELELLKTFNDFPGKIRISYKYDNQCKTDLTIKEYRTRERLPCNYLRRLIINPSGKIIMCTHDFKYENIWGSIMTDKMFDILDNKDRGKKIKEHKENKFNGLCSKCNYNMTDGGKIFYVKA